jgi:hypothetical protein
MPCEKLVGGEQHLRPRMSDDAFDLPWPLAPPDRFSSPTGALATLTPRHALALPPDVSSAVLTPRTRWMGRRHRGVREDRPDRLPVGVVGIDQTTSIASRSATEIERM